MIGLRNVAGIGSVARNSRSSDRSSWNILLIVFRAEGALRARDEHVLLLRVQTRLK